MDLSRFQDLERLEPGALRISMVDVLSREPSLGRVSGQKLEDAVDSLVNDGFALRMSDGTAMRQALLLGAGVLLRLAGASVPAIRTELEQRDDDALRGVMTALLARMGGGRPASGPSPAASSSRRGHAPRADRSPMPAPVQAGGQAGRQSVGQSVGHGSAPNVPRPATDPPSRAGARDNPALRFLNGLITDDVASLIRRANTGPSNEGPLDASAVPARAWVELTVADGVRFELTVDQVRALSDERRRGALLDGIRARLDALYR